MSDRTSESMHDTAGSTAAVQGDAFALVQRTLQETLRQSQEDLRLLAERQRHLNKRKKALRDYIRQLRALRALALGRAREENIDLCHPDPKAEAALRRLFEELTVLRKPADEDTARICYELCIPEQVPPSGIGTFGQLDDTVDDLESRLQTLGDDAQLLQLAIQDAVQKHQQCLQMLSNISKSQHNTLVSIINNLK